MLEHVEQDNGCVACGFAWPCDASLAEARAAALEAENGRLRTLWSRLIACTTNRSGQRRMIADGAGRAFSGVVNEIEALLAGEPPASAAGSSGDAEAVTP